MNPLTLHVTEAIRRRVQRFYTPNMGNPEHNGMGIPGRPLASRAPHSGSMGRERLP